MPQRRGNEGKPAILPWEFGAALFVGLFVLFGAISLVVFQNHTDVRYVVDAESGITMTVGAKVHRIHRFVLVLSLLSGSAGPIGSALLAQSREETQIPWDEVRRVWFHPSQHLVEVRDSVFRMTRLFCPPDFYEEIATMVQAGVAAHPAQPYRIPRRKIAELTGWAIAALGAALVVPAREEELAPWGFGAAALVILARVLPGRMARLLAAASLMTILVAFVQVASSAVERTDFSGLFVVYGYERDTNLLGITCVGILVLAGMASWQLLRR